MKVILRLSVLCLVLSLPVVLAVPAQAAEPILIRVSHEAPVGHFSDVAIKFWAKRAEELAKGGVKVQIFPAGQLYSDREAVRALARGDLEMNVSITSWLVQIEPKIVALNLPYLFDSTEDFVNAWKSDVGRVLAAGLERNNVRGLALWPTGRIAIGTKRPLARLEDFKGMKLRVSGGRPHEVAIRALGGQAVTLPAPEVAAAIETGVVDGTNGAFGYWAANFPTSLPYATITRMWRSGFGVWTNAKFWDRLPTETRRELERAMQEATELELKQVAQQEEETAKKAQERGAKILVLPEAEEQRWKTATAGVAAQFPDLADVVAKVRKTR